VWRYDTGELPKHLESCDRPDQSQAPRSRNLTASLEPSSNAQAFNIPRPSLSPPIPPRMRPPTRLASTALRTWTKHPLPRSSVPAIPVTASQSRAASTTGATAAAGSSFESPFGRSNEEAPSTTKIPDFSHYMSRNDGTTNRVFQYFMVGSMGLLAAAGAKATVQGKRESITKWAVGFEAPDGTNSSIESTGTREKC
jgi:hypothetical protein